MRASTLKVMGICLFVCIGFAVTAAAQPACLGTCNPAMDCRMPCYDSGSGVITCGEYQNCFADPDNDGILWWNDNCPMNHNPGQENCDGDDLGDICDSRNEKWILTENNFELCYIDVDDHLFHQTLEAYSRQVYTNICGVGGTCIKHYLLGSGPCPRPLSSAFCCDEAFPEEACDAFLKKDLCGTPKCSF